MIQVPHPLTDINWQPITINNVISLAFDFCRLLTLFRNLRGANGGCQLCGNSLMQKGAPGVEPPLSEVWSNPHLRQAFPHPGQVSEITTTPNMGGNLLYKSRWHHPGRFTHLNELLILSSFERFLSRLLAWGCFRWCFLRWRFSCGKLAASFSDSIFILRVFL
ncbi:hypothetical protein ES703_123468 [subsurface metagenome]